MFSKVCNNLYFHHTEEVQMFFIFTNTGSSQSFSFSHPAGYEVNLLVPSICIFLVNISSCIELITCAYSLFVMILFKCLIDFEKLSFLAFSLWIYGNLSNILRVFSSSIYYKYLFQNYQVPRECCLFRSRIFSCCH